MALSSVGFAAGAVFVCAVGVTFPASPASGSVGVAVVSAAAETVSRLLVVVGSVAVGAASVVGAVAALTRLTGSVVCAGATVGSETTDVGGAEAAAAGEDAGEAAAVVVGKATGRI